MNDEHGQVQKEKSIFDYLTSRLDIYNLQDAMEHAAHSTPQTIEITLSHMCRQIDLPRGGAG